METPVASSTGAQSEVLHKAPLGPPAGHVRRLTAMAIDVALLIAVAIASGSWIAAGATFGLYACVSLRVAGRTLGKALTGLRVQQADGSLLTWPAALLRSTVGYVASAFLLLGFLNILDDPRRRGWHDLLFRSEVVQDPGRLSLGLLSRQLDRWAMRMDEWRERRLAFLDRLRTLWDLLLASTRLLTGLLHGTERVVVAIASLFGMTASSGALATAPAVLTAIAIAGASVATVEFATPPAVRQVIFSRRPLSLTAATDYPGVVASLTRFDLDGDVLMVEVNFKNAGDGQASFWMGHVWLVDEATVTKTWETESGRTGYYHLAPGATHTAWYKFVTKNARGRRFLVQVEYVKLPFEHLVAR